MARGQLNLFEEKNIGEHGGDVRRGSRKTRRPFSAKRAMHLTLRATQATGPRSFLQKRNANFIRRVLQSSADKRAVQIYRQAIVSNHLHLLIRAKSKKDFQDFLKEISGKIARFVTGAKKGKAFGRFFDRLAYTRLISWGREFRTVAKYIEKNTLEALGLIPHIRHRPKVR